MNDIGKESDENASNTRSKKILRYLFKKLFSRFTPCDPTDPYNISSEELRLVHCCSTLSKAIYAKNRWIPPDAGEIIHESVESSKFVIPYFITLSSVFNTLFVCYRGSYCVDDYLVDFKGNIATVPGGHYHAGAYKTFLEMSQRTLELLWNLATKENKKIIFTGHSLGGSTAAAICIQMHESHPEIDCRGIIFGPAASVSENLWQESRKYVDNYVIHGDFVPHMTIHNIEQVSSDFFPSSIVKIIHRKVKTNFAADKVKFEPVDVDIMPVDYNPFAAPPPPRAELPKWDGKLKFNTAPLYPPGEPYGIYLKESGNSLEIRKIRNCEYFRKFSSDFNELHHMMGVYRDWIDLFVQQYEDNNPESKAILGEVHFALNN